MSRLHVCAGLLLVCLLGLSGCAGPNPLAVSHGAAGFWPGLWHGLICPIAFVISLFNHGVAMYEVNNVGGWYNLGFILGAGAWGILRTPGGKRLPQFDDGALLSEVERRGLAPTPVVIDDLEEEGEDEEEDETEVSNVEEDTVEEEYADDGEDLDEDEDEDENEPEVTPSDKKRR